ncbi:unnamed protein product [Citrullus colocynthis]|uniref:Uncharacterized protein n=1 Tax=Citrullus colocynthis TaxID=252529 RepID=A0ABP0Z2K7_9ROSI
MVTRIRNNCTNGPLGCQDGFSVRHVSNLARTSKPDFVVFTFASRIRFLSATVVSSSVT